jgi:hypothetical protein
VVEVIERILEEIQVCSRELQDGGNDVEGTLHEGNVTLEKIDNRLSGV